MDVLVSGSSGLIGTRLRQALREAGHHPIRLVRETSAPKEGDTVRWQPTGGHIESDALEGIDAVVHLAGEPLLGRWTQAKRRRVRESRVEGTRLLAATLAGLDRPPSVLLSGSAVGYYGGDHGDEVLTEGSPPGDDFMARVCRDWEAATQPAADAGIRVVHLRTGPAVAPEGDLLSLQLPFFKLGLGGKVGDGRQWYSWISLTDHVRAQLFLLDRDDVSGPVNVTAPEPVQNREFARTLGRVLDRPVFLTLPPFVLSAVFGSQFTSAMPTASQRALPVRLEGLGFEFLHPTIEQAFRAELDTA